MSKHYQHVNKTTMGRKLYYFTRSLKKYFSHKCLDSRKLLDTRREYEIFFKSNFPTELFVFEESVRKKIVRVGRCGQM